MKWIIVVFIGVANLWGGIMTKEVTYSLDGTSFRGFLAWDGSMTGARPGILVFHEWWGLNDFARLQAKKLAEMGYIAFAPDMYGNGDTALNQAMAAKMSSEVRGTPRMRERARLALQTLLSQSSVDSTRIAAIGFCFGGTAALELAYTGASINGVVAFHAGLSSPAEDELKGSRTKFLILHGADDPYAPLDTINRFQAALRHAGVDWRMIYFSNAVHGFMNSANGTDNSRGVAYNPAAAARAWEYMRLFFREVLPPASENAGK
jgi:dienelactone hydrolase